MNRTKIDWTNPKEGWSLDYTWNPCYGCTRGCVYCYARAIHEWRREAYIAGKNLPQQYKYKFDTIQFFPERLQQPDTVIKFSTIFVGDMGDIAYQKPENVQAIIDVCKRNQQHRFLFLTKTFDFYNQYHFPSNCWLGITLVSGTWVDCPGYQDFVSREGNSKFVSLEPLLGSFADVDLSYADWVIVGKKTGRKFGMTNELLPSSWLDSIKHDNIFYKKSIQRYL